MKDNRRSVFRRLLRLLFPFPVPAYLFGIFVCKTVPAAGTNVYPPGFQQGPFVSNSPMMEAGLLILVTVSGCLIQIVWLLTRKQSRGNCAPGVTRHRRWISELSGGAKVAFVALIPLNVVYVGASLLLALIGWWYLVYFVAVVIPLALITLFASILTLSLLAVRSRPPLPAWFVTYLWLTGLNCGQWAIHALYKGLVLQWLGH